ncbi:MAG TPA: 3'(2'),5'-bisphosphate nucleotidase CysQ, partial [Polyangia bacterium]|nr:3'(2'),5'-bisphosphate nucleotidase CysQ [Polyangia bacterium]
AAAREAGGVILRHYGLGGVAVETKSDNSPVTIADREANAAILARLAAAYPDDAILSEEAPDDPVRLAKTRVWIVDPLDGTRDFVARTGEFCVHVGLAVDGVATVGVVHQPVSGATFLAARGGGAFIEVDGERTRLAVSAEARASAARLGVSRLNLGGDLRQALAAAGLEKQAVPMGASVKLMAVARGALDAVVNFSAAEMEWDTCAPEVVVREAGGSFTDLDGRPFTYNQRDLSHRQGSVASNGACHAALLALLRPYFHLRAEGAR